MRWSYYLGNRSFHIEVVDDDEKLKYIPNCRIV